MLGLRNSTPQVFNDRLSHLVISILSSILTLLTRVLFLQLCCAVNTLRARIDIEWTDKLETSLHTTRGALKDREKQVYRLKVDAKEKGRLLDEAESSRKAAEDRNLELAQALEKLKQELADKTTELGNKTQELLVKEETLLNNASALSEAGEKLTLTEKRVHSLTEQVAIYKAGAEKAKAKMFEVFEKMKAQRTTITELNSQLSAARSQGYLPSTSEGVSTPRLTPKSTEVNLTPPTATTTLPSGNLTDSSIEVAALVDPTGAAPSTTSGGEAQKGGPTELGTLAEAQTEEDAAQRGDGGGEVVAEEQTRQG